MVPLHFNPNFRLFIYLALSIFILSLSGCRSKKASIDKRKEKVVEITANDIKSSNKINIETSAFKVTQLDNLKLKSQDPGKSSKIIYKGDTLSFTNAVVDFSSGTTTEDNSSSSNLESTVEDKSKTKKEVEKSHVKKAKATKSTSWGLNLGIFLGLIVIVILVYFHFQKPKNPLA